ncbi:hypothetical protein GGF32_004185 [Allomyces javanicus]|nr:hypothetical protein GGF32_004185 [Allomyces javanicus]
MHSKALFVTILALVASLVNALPNGAPACAINVQKITAGMGEPQGDRNFKLQASSMEYEPGKPLSLMVTSTNGAIKTHKGLLLYVEPASGAKERIGQFKIPTGFKSNVDKCAALHIKAGTDSIITHDSPADKPLGAAIEWTAPATDMGDLVVRAVVAGAGPKNWQVLDPVTLKPKAGTTTTAMAPPMDTQPPMDTGYGNGNGGGMTRKVCKKWRKKGTGTTMPAEWPMPTSPAETKPAEELPASTMPAETMPAGGYPAGPAPTETAPAGGYPANPAPAPAPAAPATTNASETPAPSTQAQGQQAATSEDGNLDQSSTNGAGDSMARRAGTSVTLAAIVVAAAALVV